MQQCPPDSNLEQPLRLEIKRKLFSKSERVKCIDLHPTEPWLLTCLYSGHVNIWNHETGSLVKSFEITQLPVRTCKFIARKSWFVVGSDDNKIRVFNYNTLEKIVEFEAHSDYIRCVAVHPSLPYIVTCSDDTTIKLWDWERNWKLAQTFEGHTHYVMMVVFNPKDSNTFASASLDTTIKIWSLGSANPNYTLEGHEKGINCLDYFHGGEKPYLISGADDRLVKVWDYQNKSCVQTLEGHAQNVTSVSFHPDLPLIISGSEDGTVRLWHANTYRLENTLNYGLERVWSISYQRGSNDIGIGYDEGSVVIKLGREEPTVSMDQSGKIIWAKNNNVYSANIKLGLDESVKDGDRLVLPVKDLSNSEVFPQMLQHNPNGRFVAVCGDGQYIIYTSLAWRNKTFGDALEFAWGQDTSGYAVRENSSKVKIYKNFAEKSVLKPSFSAEGIHGGYLLAIRSSSFLCFYDWETSALVRRIDIAASNIYWADNGSQVCIACDGNYYILKYDQDAVARFLASGEPVPEEGIEDAFEVLSDISETIKTGVWVGECFIYTSIANRLNYFVGGQVYTIAHFDKNMYLLGYLPKENRVYLCDKDVNFTSYSLSLSVVEFQTAILRKDYETSEKILPLIPNDQRNRVARFLESQDLKELALRVSTDPEHKFELAITLHKLDLAVQIAEETDSDAKWKQLADLALQERKIGIAEQCLKKARDLPALILLYTVSANADGLRQAALVAADEGKFNLAFASLFQLGEIEKCIEILIAAERIPEAAFLARTYLPSQVSPIVKLWRQSLEKTNKRLADSLADPMEYENLFPDLLLALKAEELFKRSRRTRIPASAYPNFKNSLDIDMIEEAKNSQLSIPEIRRSGTPSRDELAGDEEAAIDNISDNMSHISMEVNTTGTGSLKGDDLDLDGLSESDAAASATAGDVAGDEDLDELLES